MSDDTTPDDKVVSLKSTNEVVIKADFMSEKGGLTLPSAAGGGVIDIESYARMFENMMLPGDDSMAMAAKALGVEAPSYAIKGNAPPTAFTYGQISYAPDAAVNGGVMQWPGLAPGSLKKIVRENVAPQLIIGMREDDVMRYSNLSREVWKPGWRVVSRDLDEFDQDESEGKAQKKDIQEAERFIQNSNITTGYTNARARDQAGLTGFAKFLCTLVRDTLTFDGIALWTDMDNGDKVKAYTLLPAGNIRMAMPKIGYQGNPLLFAVAVDDGNRVIQAFNRDELTFYVRNPRTDPDVFGYGYSEVEIAIRLIKGFQNALDMNIDIFDKSSIANGIMTLSGGSVTQKQIDLLTRLFTNMKKGVSKSWALPVIGLPTGAELKIEDLSKLKGNEAYYKEFMNMLAGAFCTVWRFPVRRLGYRISGGHKDAEPLPDAKSQTDEEDPGLSPLLTHIEILLNEYLIATRWPHLRLEFTGKSPKEDSRAYEAQSLAMTWGERRRQARLPPLKTLAKGADNKKLAEVMELAPVDPNMATIFSTIASAMMSEGEDAEKKNNTMTSSKDPAKSEAHGKTSGVRRDSAGEKDRAAS